MAKTEFDELMSIGIDIGKDTFHIVGFDPRGQRVLRKQIKRLGLEATFEKLPRCIVGIEACLPAESPHKIVDSHVELPATCTTHIANFHVVFPFGDVSIPRVTEQPKSLSRPSDRP